MKMISYAQNYEDVILMRALEAVDKGFYIDVGAQHPINDSVTKAFYEKGWRGVNIEPVSRWFELLQQDRPEDINLRVAVSSTAGEYVLHEVVDTGLSTSISSIAECHKNEGREIVSYKVPVLSLDEIIASSAPVDIHFLKIDVEGAERDVLKSISFDRHRPWILVIEATLPNSQTPAYSDWEPLVLGAGYLLVYEDGINRFYLAAEHGELKGAFRLPPNYFDFFVPYHEWWTREQLRARERELDEARKLADLATINERVGRAESMVTRLQSELARAERERFELHDKLVQLEEEAVTRLEQLHTQDAQIAEVRIKLKEMDALQARVAELKGERQSLQCVLDESRAHAAKLYTRMVSSRALRLQLARQVHVLRDEVERAVRISVEHQHENESLRTQLRQATSEAQDLLSQVQTLIATVAELEADKRGLEAALSSVRDEVAAERAAKREIQDRLVISQDQVTQMAREQGQLQQGLRMHERQLDELLAHLDQILSSRSWRFTSPLRAASRMLGTIRRKLLGATHGVAGGVLRVIAHIPGARAAGRRLLADHPILKGRLVDMILRRPQGLEGDAGQAAETMSTPRQSPEILSRSAREALALIRRYRDQSR